MAKDKKDKVASSKEKNKDDVKGLDSLKDNQESEDQNEQNKAGEDLNVLTAGNNDSVVVPTKDEDKDTLQDTDATVTVEDKLQKTVNKVEDKDEDLLDKKVEQLAAIIKFLLHKFPSPSTAREVQEAFPDFFE